MFPEIGHGGGGFPYTRKNHLVRLPDQRLIVGNQGFDADAMKAVYHGVDVACVIFDDDNVHNEAIRKKRRSDSGRPGSCAPGVSRQPLTEPSSRYLVPF